MLEDTKFVAVEPITEYQSLCASAFLKAIFSEDVKEFWSVLAKTEQSYITGIYQTNKHFGEEQNLEDLLKDIQEEIQEEFKEVKNNYGKSQKARYTKDGDVHVYFLENIQTSVSVISPIQTEVFTIVLTPETVFLNGDYKVIYKLKLANRLSDDI
ncbi:hypothetical protein [Bacillus subtilis]|uniref:hypothetical protein n=1 Tax=Bacillus subtilis TaxID=1423 RepID=UPI00081C57E6|nr:hypothetical protein [Bacillus subtilis]AOA54581.1 hypothetical protein BSHJ0_02009 [Bacillus subtilis]CAF1910163.1 hypothetical protein NRS6206_03068 [Bacillus subtilis]